MPRKTITIFITVFVLVGGLVLGGYYYYMKKNASSSSGMTQSSGYNVFNPFSSGSDNSSSTSTPTTNTDTQVTDNGEPKGELVQEPSSQTSKLHRITDFAVAGATYFDDTRPIAEVVANPTDTSPVATPTPTKTTNTKNKKVVAPKPALPKFEIVPSIKYVERVTGHIYQMYLDTKAVGKVSNSTIPSIGEALFDGTAKTLIYRYISSDSNAVSSFIGTLGGSRSEFLPSNITDISISLDKTKFFYLTKSSGGVIGTVRSFNETKSSQVFSSPYTEWVSQWIGKDKLILTTRASWGISGNAYVLNTANGLLSKVFGGVKGLTTLANADGSMILYSNSDPRLGIFDVKNHTTSDINTFGLAEKCVWSADNVSVYCAVPNDATGTEYPDSWYQGLDSFNDRFVKINSVTGDTYEIANSLNETEPVDAIKPFLDRNESKLFFINKKDSTLWSLDLE